MFTKAIFFKKGTDIYILSDFEGALFTMAGPVCLQ